MKQYQKAYTVGAGKSFLKRMNDYAKYGYDTKALYKCQVLVDACSSLYLQTDECIYYHPEVYNTIREGKFPEHVVRSNFEFLSDYSEQHSPLPEVPQEPKIKNILLAMLDQYELNTYKER